MNRKTNKQIQNENCKKNRCIHARENADWGLVGYDTVWLVWGSAVSINV